tara:strand:+ start:281 stop:655 length:375 start_codon:yes stop_codon:yes gene_type:complete
MTWIDAVGVLQYYTLYNISYQSRIVMINGLLYHGLGIFYDNKYILLLKYYDVVVNSSIIMYNGYYHPSIIPYGLAGCSFFIINSLYTPTNYRLLNNYDEEIVRSVLHVIFVQGFFLYLLYTLTC